MKILRLYYAATAVFLILDFALDFNVRLAFLEPWPGWRAAYYVFCFACFGLIVRRPDLSTWTTTFESLITLSALLIGMGVRVMTVSETMLTTGGNFVTVEEIINFMVAAGAAYIAWMRGTRAIQRDLRQ